MLQRQQIRRIAGVLLIAYGMWTITVPLMHQLPTDASQHSGHGHMH